MRIPLPRCAASLALLASLLSWPRPAAALSAQEAAFLGKFRTMLAAAPDPCKLAPRLAAEYRLLLREAGPAQDAADVLKAVEGKKGLPLRLGEGLRLSGGFAIYDPETQAVYLSSADVMARTAAPGCPGDEELRRMARATVGVYVHEVCHDLEHRALGGDLVTTSEGEVLAYARETRFLAGLKDWPSREAAHEAWRREQLEEQVRINREVLGWVAELKAQEPSDKALEKLKDYVDILESNRQLMEKLKGLEVPADPFEVSLATMLAAWRKGWTPFVELMLRQTTHQPSLAHREQNLAAAQRYLEQSRAGLAEEEPGTLAYQALQRAVRLAEQDLRFWGDEKQVARALEFYKRGFREVRPAPADAPAAARP